MSTHVHEYSKFVLLKYDWKIRTYCHCVGVIHLMMKATILCKCQIHLLSCFAVQRVLTRHFGCGRNSNIGNSVFPLFRHYRKENQTSHQMKITMLTITLHVYLLVYCWKDRRWQLLFLIWILYFSIFTRHVCFYPSHIFPSLFGWHLEAACPFSFNLPSLGWKKLHSPDTWR